MVNIARRGRRRRTYTRYIRRARGRSGSKGKGMIDGLLAGAAASLAKKYINFPFVDDLAMLGIGYFRNNNTLKVIGAIGIGSDLVSIMPGGTSNGGYIG